MKKTENVIDLDLSVTRKKRFRIDKDNNRILELDTSDISVLKRLEAKWDEIQNIVSDANDTEIQMDDSNEEVTDASLKELADRISDLDTKLRNILDYIFDSNVSEVCAPSGTMFDPFKGKLRYEHILEALTHLYENNLEAEYKAMAKRAENRASKYIEKES